MGKKIKKPIMTFSELIAALYKDEKNLGKQSKSNKQKPKIS